MSSPTSEAPAQKARRIRLLYAAAVVVTWLLLSVVAAQDTTSSIDEAIDMALENQAVALDPQLRKDILADIGIFAGNYCYSEDDPCVETITNVDVMSQMIEEHLGFLRRRDATVETLASILAKSIDSDIERTGWSSHRPNDVGVLTVPEDLADAVFLLRTATGDVEVGGPAEDMLMRPGRKTLIARTGDDQELMSVRVEPLSSGEWIRGHDSIEATADLPVTPDVYCRGGEDPPSHEALTPFNWGRAVMDEPRSHAVAAATQVALDISVVDETGQCDSDCAAGLGSAFAWAIAVWRSGCERCEDNALSVIALGDRVWLDRRAVWRLRSFQDRFPAVDAVDLGIADASVPFSMTGAPALTVPIRSIVGYEQLVEPALVEKLCRVESPTGNDWISRAQGFLCDGRQRASGQLEPVLTLMANLTDCGPGAIACGKPGGAVQLTTSGYTYKVASPSGATVVGDPARRTRVDAKLVILHEVGHWFGLPHLEDAELKTKDIMLSQLDPRHVCVSSASLALLTNVTDMRFRLRAGGNQALRLASDEDYGSESEESRR